MVLGDKVVAAVKPDESQAEEQFFGGDVDDDGEEDCMCACFCDDEEEEDTFSNPITKDGPENEENDEDESDEEKGEGVEEEEEEEGLVDPHEELKGHCAQNAHCTSLKEKLDECTARVQSKSKTAETCVEELIDFLHCVDHCVSKSLFSKLK